MRPRGRRSAFTIVELIAVIVVLAILAVVLVPRFIDYRDRALITTIAANIDTVVRVSRQYEIDFGALPDGLFNSQLPPPLLTYFDDAPLRTNPMNSPSATWSWDNSDPTIPACFGIAWNVATRTPADDAMLAKAAQQLGGTVDNGGFVELNHWGICKAIERFD